MLSNESSFYHNSPIQNPGGYSESDGQTNKRESLYVILDTTVTNLLIMFSQWPLIGLASTSLNRFNCFKTCLLIFSRSEPFCIGATIRKRKEIPCLPYAFFFVHSKRFKLGTKSKFDSYWINTSQYCIALTCCVKLQFSKV